MPKASFKGCWPADGTRRDLQKGFGWEYAQGAEDGGFRHPLVYEAMRETGRSGRRGKARFETTKSPAEAQKVAVELPFFQAYN
ncbi:hypothetical protein EGW65_00335 [Enterococcus faecium]|nr:hypothetical protein EGW41_00335 [Enterococcus faecium]ROY32569.1 hypothetical protein EGW52_00930 [Enterococcus faecium]ROY45392.1 hypothetical protein EGW51_00930 [Enterococcus faecium]ROY53629.1 hypothetical protein EGW75_00945 [Enterococcus faecium]ROY67609.1 hypothetical protein EGW65_00335 [Enterococcus faecium]